jgi:hypothetical protein
MSEEKTTSYMIFDLENDKLNKEKVKLFIKFANNTLEQFKKYNLMLKEFKTSIKTAHWPGSVYYFSFDSDDVNNIIGFAHTRKNKDRLDLLTLITKNMREKDVRSVPKYKNAGTNLINKIIEENPRMKSLYVPEVKNTAEGFYKKFGFTKVIPQIISYELNINRVEPPKEAKESKKSRMIFSKGFRVGGGGNPASFFER